MALKLEISRYIGGEPITQSGPFHHEVAARQAILDHSGLIDLPEIIYGANYGAPRLFGILEFWIINDIEYTIRLDK